MPDVPDVNAEAIFEANAGHPMKPPKKPKKTYHTPPVDTTA